MSTGRTYVTTRAEAVAADIAITTTLVIRQLIAYGPDTLAFMNVGANTLDGTVSWSVDDSEYLTDYTTSAALSSVAPGETRQVKLPVTRGAYFRLQAIATGGAGILTARVWQFPPEAAE
jgi:hypothetical protein